MIKKDENGIISRFGYGQMMFDYEIYNTATGKLAVTGNTVRVSPMSVNLIIPIIKFSGCFLPLGIFPL